MSRTEIAQLAKWRRLEKRAVAGYEHDLLLAMKELAADATPVLDIEVVQGTTGVLLDFVMPYHRLILAGMAPATVASVRRVKACSSGVSLVADVGRYGSSWWLVLTEDHDRATLLSSHLRLIRRKSCQLDAGPDPDRVEQPLNAGVRGAGSRSTGG